MIYTTSVGNTTTDIFTATGDVATTVVYLCNDTASAETVDVYLKPSGTAAGKIYSNVTIAAYDTMVMDVEKLLLGNGDKIQAAAGNASVIQSTVVYTSV